MAGLVFHNLEENAENSDGDALTLYFQLDKLNTPVTDAEVRRACKKARGKHVIGADLDDEGFGWKVCPTSVSERAGLVRVQVWPCG